jgi:GMP synthase (glutamine-hydrolysing)
LPETRETVLILDFGSQYTQLIARRCREEGVFSRIEPWDWAIEEIKRLKPIGIILSGGPNSVYAANAPRRWDDLAQSGIQLLGICYGMQMMVLGLGGEVQTVKTREYGREQINIIGENRLLEGLKPIEPVWMSHGDQATELPQWLHKIAVSGSNIIAAVEAPQFGWYGVQFHPEVSQTPSGARIIRNFLYDICGARGEWSMHNYLKETISDIKKKVKKGRVICALSGGIDSSVAATMVHAAIGDRLYCVFVNNGLLRKGEVSEIEGVFKHRFRDKLIVVDASNAFLKKLKGVDDPEEKRRRIGHQFIEVFKQVASKIPDAHFLVQGTLYPDVIESSKSRTSIKMEDEQDISIYLQLSFEIVKSSFMRGHADIIKTHHNVGGLPKKLGFQLIEPLRELFKDEVRQLGRELGLPDSTIMRHPFPGPGLAVRILGEVTAKDVELLQEVDNIFIDELRKYDLYNKVSQSFAVLLPVRSVGVMGDGRTYERVVALRSVDTRDFMTAEFSPLPHDRLARIATRIINEVRGVNRVVYDITSKPPATVEWE